MRKGRHFKSEGEGKFIVNLHTYDNGLVLTEETQTITFLQPKRDENGKVLSVQNGIIVEQGLEILANRLEELDRQVPDRYTRIAITKIEEAIAMLARRDSIRKEQNKVGTLIP